MISHSGTHWKELRSVDPELYNLCFWQAAKCYPEFDDPEDGPAAVDMAFGSQGASLTLNLIDWAAQRTFGWGHCALLALAIHDLTGARLALFTKRGSKESWQGHAAVLTADGDYLDILGPTDGDEIRRRYSIPAELESEELSRGEFLSRVCGSPEIEADPYAILGTLERRFLHHFAELVTQRWL